MRSLRSLSSQKTGAIYSLVLLVAVMALVVGILSVSSAKFSTSPGQQFSPRWVQASAPNASLNITITNDASSPAAIRRVDISKPTAVSNIECGPGTSVTGGEAWTCSRTATVVRFDHTSGLAAGSSVNFSINITPPAGAGNYSFTIDTFEAGGGNTNSTSINVSVDANPPSIRMVNISTSLTNSANVAFRKNISDAADFTSSVHVFLPNASGITIVVEVLDNGSEVGNVTLVYNYTYDINQVPIQVPRRDITGNITVNMTNQSFGSSSLFGYTIPTGTFVNGSKVVFSILANDTVGNYNISNKTATVGWNFTIDAAAPRFEDVQIANNTQLTTNTAGNAINTTSTAGSTVEHILNSSLLLNVSALVSDGGGSGVVKVEIMNRSGAFTILDSLSTGTNGSASQTVWNYSLYNITDLARPDFNGNGLYNLSFRITDNVSNVVNSNFTVEVDDTRPTGSVMTNITIDGKLSEGNATLNVDTNASFNITLTTSSNINNVTRNISVFGNKGLIFNLTYRTGTPSGTATWSLLVENATVINLSNFCDLNGNDGSTCNFRFNFSDVLGRFNDTINLTVVTDAVVPNVSIVAPVSILTNYSTSVLINVSVNDSVGPLRNVSFRWRNTTSGSEGTQSGGSNVSNWQSMTLSSGGNSQFSAQGYWNGTLDISALVDGNYSIEINATDSAGRQNATLFIAQVIFDSTRPLNVSIRVPASNSFHKDNTTFTGWGTTNITAVANETRNTAYGNQSGIFNVSFRLENSSFNWPWVPSVTYGSFGGLVPGVLFSPNNANFTHWGGELTNATNGNFTIRLNVTDTAGNQNTSVTINVTIDTVLPRVSFISPGNNLNQTGNFTINATVTESNVATAWFRWVNDSSKTDANGRGNWTLMTANSATTFNATFINLTVTPALFDGNYSIEINVTDKTGNQNASVYITLILDNNQPLIVASGSNQTGLLDNSNQTGDFVVNLTINDTGSWVMNLGKITTRNINGSAFRLENATFNGSWLGLPFTTADMTNTDSNRTNSTFTFSSVANGLYNIRFMVNDTAGNQNNSVRINNVMLDNVAPGVALAVNNLTPAPSGGSGIAGTLTFNASITDNLPVNISIGNTTTQNNKFGVFYRFESASVTTSWLPMSTNSFSAQSLGQPHNVVFNASNITTTLTDGDYKLRINATDSAGNQNASVFVEVTIQNSASSVRAKNLTFLEGLWNEFGNSSTDTYTFLTNTTANATCLYSLNTKKDTYGDMLPQTTSNTMSNNVSREHRISFGSRSDSDKTQKLYYACKDVSGNFTAEGSLFTFGIDTRNRWNVTMPGKTDNKWPNYFQPAASGSSNGWSSFVLATGALEATTLASAVGGFNVTNVLASLMQGTGAGNLSRIYAYTASTNSWETFVVARTSNSFINFTNQTTYWINITAVERLEIN